MAKILVVSEKFSATSWSLAEALSAQQHNVGYLTSSNKNLPNSDRIQIFSYFKRSNFLEGIKSLPLILGFQPQIVHIVLEEDQMTTAQMIIAAFVKTLPNCVLTTSMLHIRHRISARNPVRLLIKESDIITCPSLESMAHLRGIEVRSTRQGRGILPPVLQFTTTENTIHVPEKSDLISQLRGTPFVVIPFLEKTFDPSSKKFQNIALIAAHIHVVLHGSQDDWTLRERKLFQSWMDKKGLGHQWSLTGDIASDELIGLLQAAEGYVIAGQNFSPIETTECFLRSLQTKCTLIMDSKQSTIHAGIWKSGINAWILPHHQIGVELQKLLSQSLKQLSLDQTPDLNISRDLIDAPLNDLNRLYNKALSQGARSYFRTRRA